MYVDFFSSKFPVFYISHRQTKVNFRMRVKYDGWSADCFRDWRERSETVCRRIPSHTTTTTDEESRGMDTSEERASIELHKFWKVLYIHTSCFSLVTFHPSLANDYKQTIPPLFITWYYIFSVAYKVLIHQLTIPRLL